MKNKVRPGIAALSGIIVLIAGTYLESLVGQGVLPLWCFLVSGFAVVYGVIAEFYIQSSKNEAKNDSGSKG